MTEDNMREAAFRKRRVQRLKKYIITLLMVFVTLPMVLCVVLLFQVRSLNLKIEQLAVQVEEISAMYQGTIGDDEAQSADADVQGGEQVVSASVEAQKGLSGNSGLMQEPGVAERDSEKENAVGINAGNGVSVGAEEAGKSEAAHKVYLTFDDGPSSYTDDILDILDRYEVKATFFVVGKESDSAKELMRDIVDRGHAIGMHSYSHKYAELYESEESFAADFVKIQDYLEEVTGVRSTIYRFPGGSSNTISTDKIHQYCDYLDSRGVRFFDWNISSGDATSEALSVEELVKNSTADVAENKTSVILLHDSADKRTTVEALPIIIENILAMEDTVILPITEDTVPVQHIQRQTKESQPD